MASGRGGKRPGAGRPKSSEPSKTIRCSVKEADFVKSGKLDNLLSQIEDWKYRAEDASSTSPRWEKARELLNELEKTIS